jgi:hypothetical protein
MDLRVLLFDVVAAGQPRAARQVSEKSNGRPNRFPMQKEK